jgi:PKD repeat protein
MKLKITFLLLLVSDICIADSWTTKANFGGGARVSGVGLSIAGYGYIGTGWDGANDNDDFWQYDPLLDSWTQKASFPAGPREAITCFEIAGKGYLATGTVYQDDLWEYDPASNTWTQKTNFGGNARYGAAAFSIGSKGYLGTGNTVNGQSDDWWEFDPSNNSWTQKANVPGGPRMWASGFSINSKGYIALGLDANGKRDDLQEYDPLSNSWTQKATFTGFPRDITVAFSIGNSGYIVTGRDVNSNTLGDLWQYDQVTDSWSQKTGLPGANREWAVGFTIGNKGYVGTGEHNSAGNYTPLNDFYEYTPDSVIPQMPVANLSSSDTTVCIGKCIDFTDLSINSPSSWQWLFPGADSASSNLQHPQSICYNTSGIYDVTLISCNGVGCDTLFIPGFITIHALPVPVITEINDTLFSTAAATYQWWSIDSGLIAGATGSSFAYQQYGSYYVVVTDSAGCEGASNTILTTGIYDNISDAGKVQISPNPFQNNFSITLPWTRDSYTITIWNTAGHLVFSQKMHGTDGTNAIISMAGMASGVYLVEVLQGQTRILRKIVKE